MNERTGLSLSRAANRVCLSPVVFPATVRRCVPAKRGWWCAAGSPMPPSTKARDGWSPRWCAPRLQSDMGRRHPPTQSGRLRRWLWAALRALSTWRTRVAWKVTRTCFCRRDGHESFLAQGELQFGWSLPGDEWESIALNYVSRRNYLSAMPECRGRPHACPERRDGRGSGTAAGCRYPRFRARPQCSRRHAGKRRAAAAKFPQADH